MRLIESLRWRCEHLGEGREALPLIERLGHVAAPARFRLPLEQRLLQRLRRTAAGEPYFQLNGRRIFFRPDRPGVDEPAAIDGAILILKEAFVNAPEFFHDQVTLHRGGTVLDLGGNLGTSAMLFSRIVGSQGRIYSFEPVFASIMQRNLTENRVRNVEVIPGAVSDRPGEVVFNITDRGIDSRISRDSEGMRQAFPAVCIDEFVHERNLTRIDLVKLDIEGAEELALRGGEGTIRRLRPRLTIASYHTDVEGDRQHPKLVKLLRGWGLNVVEVDGRRIYAW